MCMCADAARAEMGSNGGRATTPQSQALRPQLHVCDPCGSVVCRSPRSLRILAYLRERDR
jgi:hypothetical protein